MHTYLSKYEDKVIVVAGGTSGMGESLVRQIAPAAKKVVVLGRSEKAGARITGDMPGKTEFMQIEMKDGAAVKSLLREIDQTHGPIDYFFNFAGTFLGGEIRDTPLEDWHKIFDNNILPIANGTAAIYEIMRKNGHGAIINVASAAGLFPVPVMNIYGSTKSAVVSLTLGLRMEAKKLNIKASVVCPTIVKTPLYDTAMYDGVDKDKALKLLKTRFKAQSADVAAARILKGAAKNKSIIHTSFTTRMGWLVYRLSPALYLTIASNTFDTYRKTLRKKS